jgi:polysaccharide biosynthesis transport protein
MTTTQAAADLEAVTPVRVLHIVRKYALLVAACVAATAAATFFWSLGQQRIYRAEVMLRLDPEPARPLGQKVELVSNSTPWINHREFFSTEYRVMRSMRVAMTVVRTLGLHADPAFLNVPAARRADFKPWPVEDAATLLISRISVDPVKDSSLVILRYEDADPTRCQTVLNTLSRTYLSQNLDTTIAVSATAEEWLRGQLEHLKTDLEKSEHALNDFRQKNNILSISLEDRHNIISSQLEQIAKETTTLEIRRFELAARSSELSKIKLDDPESVGATELLQSHVLSTLRTSYAEQLRAEKELTASLGDSHPKVIAARAKLEATAKSMKTEVQNIQAAVAKDLRSLDRALGDLKKKDEDIQKQAHELQAFEIPFNQLARTKTHNEKIYGIVLERSRETELTRMMNINNVRIVDEALIPKTPIRPNVPLNLALGAFVGLLAGVGLAVWRELGDRSLRTPNDIEALGATSLGLIPEIDRGPGRGSRRKAAPVNLGDRDLIVSQQPESGVAEAMRAVRTNLTFMSPDKPFSCLLVTSALPEEGKTTVAVSLATVLAQSGHSVVLVDTDLRRPRLHRTFQVSNDVGVTMAISGQTSLEDAIRKTDIPGLDVLSSGPVPPNPAEMVHSDRFAELVTQLKKKYDRVVFDSPPLLPVTDAAILSQHVDGVIVVSRAFRTHKGALREALKTLRDVKGRILGVVLNAVDVGRYDYKESYYYYRRDGYYRASDEK